MQADSIKKSLKGGSGNNGGCSLDSKMQQVKELEEEVILIGKWWQQSLSYFLLDGQRGPRTGCPRRRKGRKVKEAQL